LGLNSGWLIDLLKAQVVRAAPETKLPGGRHSFMPSGELGPQKKAGLAQFRFLQG